MTRERVNLTYNISLDFLTYHRLSSALKKYIGAFRMDPICLPRPIYPNQLKLLCKSNKGTRDFYNIILPTNVQSNNYRKKWEEDLNLELGTLAWKSIYRICFNTIKDNFLIWFQYKIIYRLTGTKLHLYRIKEAETSVCRLCGESNETIMYLFVQCPKSRHFWFNLGSWISDKINKKVELSKAYIIFGTLELVLPDPLVNFMIITGKYYIFKCARSDKSLNFQDFKQFVKNVHNEQLMLARIEMCTDKFSRKWTLLSDLLCM